MRQSPNYYPQITQGKGLSLGFKQRQLSEKRFDHVEKRGFWGSAGTSAARVDFSVAGGCSF